MDELDGLAVLKGFRERRWGGPAILITAFTSEDLPDRATKIGFNAVLEKPLRQHPLVDAVIRLVRDSGNTRL